MSTTQSFDTLSSILKWIEGSWSVGALKLPLFYFKNKKEFK